jgi:hypothetical protein
LLALVLTGGLTLSALWAAPSSSSGFGRLSGSVTDTQGNPLMGATVFILGPLPGNGYGPGAANEHVLTDANGEFAVERLAPGWYSLRVTSPTRLPALRNGVHIEGGRTAEQKFVLSDILSPLHIQTPSSRVSISGTDWKWVLRTSPATRPILRYQEVAHAAPAKVSKRPSTAARHLIGIMPGSSSSDALVRNPGMGSVLAYLRPLSADSDLLVAGAMGAYGPQASSVGTSFRNHMGKADPQELTLVVHQLSFADGGQFATGVAQAQGIVVGYSHTRRLSDSLSFAGGLEIDYLNSLRSVAAASPRVKLEYRVSPSTSLVARYGAIREDGDSGTLLGRIGLLNAFPLVTLRDNRLRLEQVNHAELGIHRRLSKSSRVELAAYRDYFQNAGIWAFGSPGTSAWLSSNLLPDPTSGGLILNAGNYHSLGVRATYSLTLGSHLGGAFEYAVGEALTMKAAHFSVGDAPRGFQGMLRPDRSQSLGGKVWTRIPISNTQVVTSYQWLEQGRVTGVDPYGQADLQMQPFLGVQIRQPLPTLSFFPARVEALADFRNLLGQGYVSLPRLNGKPFLLTSAYRALRGGFSVQF